MDQDQWRLATALSGPPPTPAALWRMLTEAAGLDHTRAAAFERVARSDTLKAALAQSLARDLGSDVEAIRSRIRERFSYHPSQRTTERLLRASLTKSPWKIRFANLVSGRFTELVFAETYQARLAGYGLNLAEETQERSFLDFRIATHDFVLAINLKNAGMQMREAENYFGLSSEDTIPMATYKAFGGYDTLTKRGVPLLYVFLVDWPMLGRLRTAYLEILSDEQRDVLRVLANVRKIPRDIEDSFIEDTVGGNLRSLASAVGYDTRPELPFRVISAGKCMRIFYTKHERSPYVYVQRMNTDPNVHISVRDETISFDQLIADYLKDSAHREALIADLQRTSDLAIPDPPI